MPGDFKLNGNWRPEKDKLGDARVGGGTDINGALAYCEGLNIQPTTTQTVLISELYATGNAQQMLAGGALVSSDVNLIALRAQQDDGRPAYDQAHALALAALGCPVFACTPGQFPDVMATALLR